MKRMDNFEDISAYESLILSHNSIGLNKISSLGLIVEGINDTNTFSQIFQISTLKYSIIPIFKDIYFITLNTDIKYFNDHFKRQLQLQNCNIFSIFLRKEITNNIIKNIDDYNENLFYVYYESKEKFDFKNNFHFFKIISTKFPTKIICGFDNFTELQSFYSRVVQNGTNWPAFALFPTSLKNNSKSFITKSQAKVPTISYPLFSPIKSLFYLYFAERNIQSPKRMKNVDEYYSIKQIPDLQISHLFKEESPINKFIIRTFLGFDNKFRCLQIFDYLSNNKKVSNTIDEIKLYDEENFYDVKHNFFYLETQINFDYSICFSMNYVRSFHFENFEGLSTFFEFENYEDFVSSKKIISDSMKNKKNAFIIKNIKSFEGEEMKELFADQPNSNLKFIKFKMKTIIESNKKTSLNLSSLLKSPVIIKKDVVCLLDNKKYIIAGFNNINNRAQSITMLKKSNYYVHMKSYYLKKKEINENHFYTTKIKTTENINNCNTNIINNKIGKINKQPIFDQSNSNNQKYDNKPTNKNSNDKFNYHYSDNSDQNNQIINSENSNQQNQSSNNEKKFTNQNQNDNNNNIQNSNNHQKSDNKPANKNNNDNFNYHYSDNSDQNNQINNSENSNQQNQSSNNETKYTNQNKNNNNNNNIQNSNNQQKFDNKQTNKNANNICCMNYSNNSDQNNKNINTENSNTQNKNDNKTNTKVSHNIEDINSYNKISNNNNMPNAIIKTIINSTSNNTNKNIENNENDKYAKSITNNEVNDENINIKVESGNNNNINISKEESNYKEKNKSEKPQENKSEKSNSKSNENDINEKNQSDNNQIELVNFDEYNNIKELGKGSFGIVYLVEDPKTHVKYAAKIKKDQKEEKKDDDFLQEIIFYSKCDFPLILKLHGYGPKNCEKNPTLMLLEYMPNNSLKKFLDDARKDKTGKIKKILEKKKYPIIFGIILGMCYLNKNRVIHRDLKSENILLDENYYPKISDFGSALIYDENIDKVKRQETEFAGTPLYTPPEILSEEKPYTIKYDVYSFAFIAYEVFTGQDLFDSFAISEDEKNEIKKRPKKFFEKIKNGLRPDLSDFKDQEIRMFFQKCWSEDPTERPSFFELCLWINKPQFKSFLIKDDEEAAKFYFLMFNQNNIYSKLSIDLDKYQSINDDYEVQNASILIYGNFGEKDEQKGLDKLKQLAEKNNANAHYILGFYLYTKNDPDYKQSTIHFKKAAKLGNKEATVEYGTRLLKGIGTDVNYKKAVKYYKKAADLGSIDAMFNYAHMVQFGKGIKADINEAIKYYQMSADLGNVNSMYQLGYIYEQGEDIAPNYDIAVKYYQKAAIRGDKGAIGNLGVLLSSGKTKVDLKESEKLLRETIKDGKPSNLFSFAQLLSQIALCDNINYDETIIRIRQAKKYYKKAYLLGYHEAKPYYDLIKFVLNDSKINESNFKNITNIGFMNITVNKDPFIVRLGNSEMSLIDIINKSSNEAKQESSDNETTNQTKDKSQNSSSVKVKNVKPKVKSIYKVKVNIFQSKDSTKSPDGHLSVIYLSESSFSANNFRDLEIKFRRIGRYKKEVHMCITNDPNILYTFYLFDSFDSLMSAFVILNDFMRAKHIQNYFPVQSPASMDMMMNYFGMAKKHRLPIQVPNSISNEIMNEEDEEEFLFFDEKIIPPTTLPLLIKYVELLKTNETIIDIKRNVFNGNEILTYLIVKKGNENSVINSIRDFLSTSNILFEHYNYPLQNVIMINEKIIFKEKDDFEAILNEIESIGIQPIKYERNKLFSYDFYPNKKLFQVFSFICFKNEKEKMEALNHINKIIYKGKKNILEYKLNLKYARIDEVCIPFRVRHLVPELFQYFKGVEDIQRCVLSIENSFEKTYIGFDSYKHMKKCYYKFVYRLNKVQFIPDVKLFNRKRGLKYMYIICGSKNYDYILKRVSGLADDIQEYCDEVVTLKKDRLSNKYKATYIGFESVDELNNAIQRLENDFNVEEHAYDIYHEGKKSMNISNDPKESYMFYNSL